jgi:hypothetical protein
MLLLFSYQKMVAKDWSKGNTKKGRVSFLLFLSCEWDPYLFFYRLKEGSYPVE